MVFAVWGCKVDADGVFAGVASPAASDFAEPAWASSGFGMAAAVVSAFAG